ncbi:MAG: CsgG/HfaB family protein [Calditrichia bacterium]
MIKSFVAKFGAVVLFIAFLSGGNAVFAGVPSWYTAYQNGLNAVEAGDWNSGIENFREALKSKNKDSGKMRAFGAIFIEYYPHRELGICYYHIGDAVNAEKELQISLKQSSSTRATEYMALVSKMDKSKAPAVKTPEAVPETPSETQPTLTPPASSSETRASEIVGDRLSIAVLPFDSKGLGDELGSIDLLDKLITGFVNINRFKVIERALLEKILEEQKLGMSGILDASTAAEIGKGIGVDAVVVGSVTRTRTALSIDARLIDTETTAIITARDAYSDHISLQDISQTISDLAEKIKADLPIVGGYVISVNENKLTLDIGRSNGIRKGMKCHVYREGAPIIHPVSGKVIAREIDEICEAQITDIFDVYSTAIIRENRDGSPKIQDRVVTK